MQVAIYIYSDQGGHIMHFLVLYDAGSCIVNDGIHSTSSTGASCVQVPIGSEVSHYCTSQSPGASMHVD